MAALVHQSLTNCQGAPFSSGYAGAPRDGLFARLATTVRTWQRHARERGELAHLSARELRDMGASSADVWRETREPFWRATRAY